MGPVKQSILDTLMNPPKNSMMPKETSSRGTACLIQFGKGYPKRTRSTLSLLLSNSKGHSVGQIEKVIYALPHKVPSISI